MATFTLENKIIIPVSKSKLIRYFIFSIIFLLLGVWILVDNPQTGNPVFNLIFVKIISGIGGVLMGILGSVFYGRKLIHPKPGLIIDETGVHQNVMAFIPAFIAWDDVAGIDEYSVKAGLAARQYFVTLNLKKTGSYIAGINNRIVRGLMKVNNRMSGTPVNISTNYLSIQHKELLRILTEAYEKYKNA